ncbi:MAG: ABC transporter substrate-binding protein [Bacteroidota bacterium]
MKPEKSILHRVKQGDDIKTFIYITFVQHMPAMGKKLKLLILIVVLLMNASCNRNSFRDEGKSVFRYNESAGITSLDPAFARNQANIWAVNHMFNGLVQLDTLLKVRPGIAKRWKISSDGREYIFYLRDDVYFHDNKVFPGSKGRKITAKDFIYSFQRLSDQRLASPGAWVLGPVQIKNNLPDIVSINDTTLIIRLNEAFPPFLSMLSMQYCSVVPREAVEFYGEDFRSNPVGTGPFRFKLWKEGVKLVLIRNGNYFEEENGNRLPYLDAVAISFIIDKQTAFLEFIKGNLDFISGLDASYKDEILTPSGRLNPKYADRIKMTTQPYLNTEYLGILADESNPVMNNNPLLIKKVRQAISYGFDRKRMMRYLRNGIGEPGTHGFIPAGLPGYSGDAGYGYDYNPEKAGNLLAEAGYPMGNGLPPVTLSTNASYLDLCQFIQSQLGQIGIKMKIDVTPPATLRENIARARIPFFRGSWIADYPDAENYLSLFYSENHCPEGSNYTNYENQIFDKLYQEAYLESDISKRSRLNRKMDSLIMQDAPVIVLFYDEVLRLSGKNITGLGSNPLNLLELKRVKKTGK